MEIIGQVMEAFVWTVCMTAFMAGTFIIVAFFREADCGERWWGAMICVAAICMAAIYAFI